MPYCTQTDLINNGWEQELIQLTNGSNNTINTTVLASAQAKADSEINQYLRVKGYAANGSITSTDLKNIALDLTRFHCYSMSIPDDVQAAYDRQISKLKDFVKGVIDFDFVGAKVTIQSVGDAEFASSDTVFTSDLLASF